MCMYSMQRGEIRMYLVENNYLVHPLRSTIVGTRDLEFALAVVHYTHPRNST